MGPGLRSNAQEVGPGEWQTLGVTARSLEEQSGQNVPVHAVHPQNSH